MKRLLIVVDFQNDFVDGALGFKKACELEEIIFEKINQYQKNNDDVIFTLDTHDQDYLKTHEGKNLPVSHCLRGTIGHDLYGKVKDLAKKAIIFEKPTYPSLDLGIFLKDKNYDDIEICGLVSNICVLSNAIIVRAALPNAQIIIDSNATASYNESLNEKALDVLEGMHYTIINRKKL